MRATRLFLMLFALLPSGAAGQSVGLVMSGGGAKGMYHIGIIKALEENCIPIDYIAGTSMGAIIGGLYAVGYTPGEMEEIFLSPRVNNWITGRIDSSYDYYFKRMHNDAAMISIPIDHSGRKPAARLPLNFIPSDQLNMAFVEFFSAAGAAADNDFDQLVVPFRCIATDALNQRQVTFRDGDLGLAVRASMSLPLVYAPVKADSALLYDGGLYDNFPWRVLAEDFDPDVFIGSTCANSADNLERVDFVDQVFMVTMLQTRYELPRETDIVISHRFPATQSMDFSRAGDLIAQGYADAMEAMPRIMESISRRADPAQLKHRREDLRQQMPELMIGEIEISGLTEAQVEYVRRMLRIDRDGLPVSFEKFQSEYFKILAEGQMTGDYPRMHYDRERGNFTLSMNMTVKPDLQLKLGGNLSSSALNQAYVGMQHTSIGSIAYKFYLDGYFSAFHSSAAAAVRTDFFVRGPAYAEYGGQLNFYNYSRSNYGFMRKGKDVDYNKLRDHYGFFSLGLQTGRHSVLNATFNAGHDRFLYHRETSLSDSDPMDRTRMRFFGVKLEYERNNLNYILYPTRGIHHTFSAIYVKARERFIGGGADGLQLRENREWFGARAMREQYFGLGPRWLSTGVMAEGVWTDHPDLSNSRATNMSMPAFQPTTHSRIVYLPEFRAAKYVAAGIMPTIHISKGLYMRASGFLFLPEKTNGSDEGFRDRLRHIIDVSLVYQTPLGPASLSLSQYDTRGNNWFVTFNFGWALFNSRGTFY